MKTEANLFVAVLLAGAAIAQTHSAPACALTAGSEGEVVALRGKIVYAPHDMILEVSGCVDAVVLVYADRGGRKMSREGISKRGLAEFRKYTSATKKHIGKAACLQCPKYDVEATLTGRLAIASVPPGLSKDGLGFLRDSNGKIVGKTGFGHPIPVFKYQLTIESASGVVAIERK